MAAEPETLERELGELLDVERFEPPEDFARQARVTDDSLHRAAEQDPAAWWRDQALEVLDWVKAPQEALDDSKAPFYRWFADGTLNASYNCLDRHVEAGRGDRVAFHWRGEEGEERDLTYADLLADVQRFANVLKAHGIGRATSSGSSCR